jgi:hypothetical protein
MVSSKLSVFERRINDTQRELSVNQLTQIQQNLVLNDGYRFKKKGNEEQFKANVKVMTKLVDAECSIDNVLSEGASQAAVMAKQSISEGIDLVKHRQKLIKLADSTEHGWRVVQEYENNPLAENSDDEKKIYRAEARAGRSARVDRQKKSRRGRPYEIPSAAGGPRDLHGQRTTTQPQHQWTGQWGGQATSYKKPGNCFACGKAGHWRSECRSTGADQNTQISTYMDMCAHDVHDNAVCNCNIADCLTCFDDNINVDHIVESRFESVSENTEFSMISPVGRLKQCANHWRKAGSNDHVMEVVQNGYKLPFMSLPEKAMLGNNKSARDNAGFVQSEIDKLLLKGCISEVKTPPHVINPLTVASNKADKLRLVLDCRHVNPHLFKYKSCFEDQSVARHIFNRGDFVFSFDLKSAYHHIEIFPEHRTYLGFSCDRCGQTKYYVFNVLPFGISTAGYIFTKVCRAVVKTWRSLGFQIVLFLDDGMGGSNELESAQLASCFMKDDLTKFGFLLAMEKCHWEPTLCLTWLGHVWDMEEGSISVTKQRLENLNISLKSIISQVVRGDVLVRARRLAGVVGQIISMTSAMGPIARLKTRSMYDCILKKASWDAPVLVNSEALDELLFWKENHESLNGQHFTAVSRTPDIEIHCDASGRGYGGYVSSQDDAKINTFCRDDAEIVGNWSVDQALKSSTWRELQAVNAVLHSVVDKIEDKHVVVKTDNANVPIILRNGSKKPELQNISVEIDNLCRTQHMSVTSQWVPRAENNYADMLSKITDCDDWGIKQWVFDFLDQKWGKHLYDRFANDYNTKCALFNSRAWCKGTSGIDSFSQSWQDVNNWLTPPPKLIPKCIAKILSDSAIGTLLVPAWFSSPFWPMLFPDGHRSKFIVDQFMFKPGYLTIKGRGRNGVFDGRYIKFPMFAFRVDGSKV